MPLKERQKEPNYIHQASADFVALEEQQLNFKKLLTENLFFPEAKYWPAVEKTKNEWKLRSTPFGGGRNLESDLEKLQLAHLREKQKVSYAESSINLLFHRVYEHFRDMDQDNQVGYLEDDKFNDYLQSFEKAIELNKEVGLSCWDKPIAESLIRLISEKRFAK